MNEEYEKGFNDGIEWALKHFNPQTGVTELPSSYIHRHGVYNKGFGEGLITGRSEVIEKTFGNSFTSISWSDGKVIVK